MPISITCQSKIKTCTEGIFRYAFQVFPTPDTHFAAYLVDTRKITLHVIGSSTFFRFDTSPSSSIKGMIGDPILVITTPLTEEEVRLTLFSLFSEFQISRDSSLITAKKGVREYPIEIYLESDRIQHVQGISSSPRDRE